MHEWAWSWTRASCCTAFHPGMTMESGGRRRCRRCPDFCTLQPEGGVRRGGASGRRLRYRGPGASPDPCGDDPPAGAPPPWPGPPPAEESGTSLSAVAIPAGPPAGSWRRSPVRTTCVPLDHGGPTVVLEGGVRVSASGARRRRVPRPARSPGNRRERHLTREHVPLADVLAG